LNKSQQNNVLKDEIKLFDMNSNSDSKIHKEVSEIHQSKVTTIVVPPASKFVFVGFQDGIIKVLDLADLSTVCTC